MTPEQLSGDEARRIAIAAQGLDRPRPAGPVGGRHVREVLHRLALVQLDYVNVVVPAHYQVLFSRLGAYDTALLDSLVYRSREFTEQWAHEASIVPMSTWPLLRHLRETHRVRPWGFESVLAAHRDYVDWTLDQVRVRGPLTAGELPAPEGTERSLEHSWFGSVPRAVLEAFFGRGVLAVADRRPNFARAYDLAERVIPSPHLGDRVDREDAQRSLLRLAARAHGIGTAADLADYFRMPVAQARPRLAELLEGGELFEARVAGNRQPAYLDPNAAPPSRVEASALLSPFDPLVWYRPRTSWLFDFDYRFEIFVPEEKRRWGRYVLPFLFGERLVARVDLKSDRERHRLLVRSAYLEKGADPGAVAEALAAELRTMARWLGFPTVSVGRKGGFARALGAAVRSPR